MYQLREVQQSYSEKKLEGSSQDEPGGVDRSQIIQGLVEHLEQLFYEQEEVTGSKTRENVVTLLVRVTP